MPGARESSFPNSFSSKKNTNQIKVLQKPSSDRSLTLTLFGGTALNLSALRCKCGACPSPEMLLLEKLAQPPRRQALPIHDIRKHRAAAPSHGVPRHPAALSGAGVLTPSPSLSNVDQFLAICFLPPQNPRSSCMFAKRADLSKGAWDKAFRAVGLLRRSMAFCRNPAMLDR
jgi:hypothetical protein